MINIATQSPSLIVTPQETSSIVRVMPSHSLSYSRDSFPSKLRMAIASGDWTSLDTEEKAIIVGYFCKCYGFDPMLPQVCVLEMRAKGANGIMVPRSSLYVTADGVDAIAARLGLSGAPITDHPAAVVGSGADGAKIIHGWKCHYLVWDRAGRSMVDGCMQKVDGDIAKAYTVALTRAKRRAIMAFASIPAVVEGDEPGVIVESQAA